MEARGGGRIVNGLSAGGFMPGGIYGVSKFALHGLTINLASELGWRNINVNAIAPGLVDNDSGYVSLPKDSPFRDAIAAQIPGKPSGPPEDLVGALLLLCSRAGDWITGQTILDRRRLDHPALTGARPWRAGGPVLARSTSWGAMVARCTSRPSMAASRCSTLIRPSSPKSWRTVVRGGM